MEQPRYDQYGLPTTTSSFELPGQAYPYEQKEPVADSGVVYRLGKVFELTRPKLLPGVWAQIEPLLTKQNLYILGGLIAAWVVGHIVGIGAMVDIAIAVVGWFSIGVAVFEGLDELFEFARHTVPETGDLNKASDHLAKAIDLLGITTVLALIFKQRPKVARIEVPNEPPKTGWFRQKTTITETAKLPPGDGVTSWWGDIKIGMGGTVNEKALALAHEKVHRYFVPKLYIFRNIRVFQRVGYYVESSLYRYFEEMLAETIGQFRVNGLSWENFFVGVRFPVSNGYMYLFRAGADPRFLGWNGKGLLVEGAGYLTTVIVQGIAHEIWFKEGMAADVLKDIKENGTKSKVIETLKPYFPPVWF